MKKNVCLKSVFFTDNFDTKLVDGCLRKIENMILMREIMVLSYKFNLPLRRFNKLN